MSEPAINTSDEARTQEITRRAGRAFIWLGSTTTLWQIISWVLTLWTARILSPADYGLLALAETVNPYLAMLAGLNLGTWMIQTREFGESHQRGMFTLTVCMGAVVMGLTILVAPLVAGFYNNPALRLPFQVLSVMFLIRGVAMVPDALLRRELQFKQIGIMNVTIGAGRGLLQIALAYWGWGYWALVAGLLSKELVECVWILTLRGLPRGFSWTPDIYCRALRFGLPATFATLLWILYSSIDVVIVGKCFGTETLGYYSMALFLIDMPLSKLNTVVRPVLYPYLSRIRDIPGQLEPAFLRIVRLITTVLFPALCGVALIAGELVPLLLGSRWLPITVMLQVLCLSSIIKAFMDNIPVLFTTLGRPDLVLRVSFVGVLVLPLGFYTLASHFGLPGVYAGWPLLLHILCAANLYYLSQQSGISPLGYLRNVRAPALSTVAMALIVLLATVCLTGQISPAALLTLKIALGIAAYPAVYYLFFKADFREMLKTKSELRQS